MNRSWLAILLLPALISELPIEELMQLPVHRPRM